jgi:MTH538 TIR-like domain (DUF1863)
MEFPLDMGSPEMANQPELIDRPSLTLTARAAQLLNDLAQSTPRGTPHSMESEQAVPSAQKLIRCGAEHEIEILKEIVETGDLPTRSFRYRAFISYSRQDRRAAEWIHNGIENYRIPKKLVGWAGRDGPVPEKIFPAFRDRDDLSCASDLSASIQEALEQSAYLIVLCSRSAARSRWVNREIIQFKSLGRADRIHALIIDGEPNAESADQECYPRALRFSLTSDGELDENQPAEPLAADLRPEGDGKRNAKLKLIAGLLGVPFNMLRQREVVAARRRLFVLQAVTGLILLLSVFGALTAWKASAYYEESEARQKESEARQIPGLRIENRETMLDLSQWEEATDAELKTVKKERAISRNTFQIVRIHEHATTFIHIIGTTSAVTPEVICDGCEVELRDPGAGGRTKNEWEIKFDISRFPLDERRDIKFSVVFWNAFQKQQEWGGFRVAHPTDRAIYSIRFPDRRRPLSQTLAYQYVDSKEHFYNGELQISLDKDAEGRVKRLTWELTAPKTDRSYRVQWDWSK